MIRNNPLVHIKVFCKLDSMDFISFSLFSYFFLIQFSLEDRLYRISNPAFPLLPVSGIRSHKTTCLIITAGHSSEATKTKMYCANFIYKNK